MRISINVTNYSWPGGALALGPALADVACAAEDAGVDTVWVSDHLIQADPNSGPGDTEMLEAYSALGFIAAKTERVRLGTLVTAVTYRAPALLVKAVTTLDVLSAGRAWLGVGAGYHEGEANAMDLPLPPAAERFDDLEDTLRLARHMWSGDPAPFEGVRHRLAAPQNSPGPITRPRPPVLVGGAGEHRTLPLVARYADACNLFDIPDHDRTLKHKLGVLARHCEAAGRPYDEVEKTVSTRRDPAAPLDAFLRRCDEFAALGVDHLILISSGPWTVDAIRALAPAVAALAESEPSRPPSWTAATEAGGSSR